MAAITFPPDPDRLAYIETPWADPNGKQWTYQTSKNRWNPYASSSGGTGGSAPTNLSATYTGANVTILSSSGSGVVLAAATPSAAGVMIAADKSKLDAIAGTNTGDETAASIKSKLGIVTLSGVNTGDQDLSGLAPLNSPALTGAPTAPTPSTPDDSTKIATTAHVQAVIRALVGLAPAELDTLKEIADALASNESSDAALAATVAGKLAKASNLSDLTNAATARGNLGLGSLATQNGTFSGIFAGAAGKTLTVSNTITLSGTDGATLNIGAGGTLGSAAFASASSFALLSSAAFVELSVQTANPNPALFSLLDNDSLAFGYFRVQPNSLLGDVYLDIPTTGGKLAVTSRADGSPDKLVSGTITGTATLDENSGFALDPAGSSDEKWTGTHIAGTAGETIALGDLIYLDSATGKWNLADADAASTSGDVMLGLSLSAAAADGAINVLLHGTMRSAAFPASMTNGAPVYVSTTAGDISTTQPSGTDDVIRRVGFVITAEPNTIYFSPSADYTTHT